MTDVRIVDETEQATAVVHERVAISALPDFFTRAFALTAATAGEQGTALAGPPFALYHGMPGPEGVDVEAGFPVNQPVHDAGDVHASRLPGGTAAVAVHTGPYERLGDTYTQIRERLTEQGLQAAMDMWEEYLSDPTVEPDPETWRTVVHWPAAPHPDPEPGAS